MKILVIGAGVAGLFFASFMDEHEVIVLDKNEFAGRKLLATGNGRCNFTNLNFDKANFKANNQELIDHTIKYFTNRDLIKYFNEIGIATTNLPSGRCYPKTMSSKTVRNVLFLEAKENADFIFDEDVSNINMQNDEEIIQFLIQQFTQQFNNRLEIATDSYLKLRFIQKSILKAIDSEWIEQVDNLQQLKASVNNRQNGQRNVIFEYHKVALETYEYMSEDIKRKMVRNLCLSILTFDKDGDMVIHFP